MSGAATGAFLPPLQGANNRNRGVTGWRSKAHPPLFRGRMVPVDFGADMAFAGSAARHAVGRTAMGKNSGIGHIALAGLAAAALVLLAVSAQRHVARGQASAPK